MEYRIRKALEKVYDEIANSAEFTNLNANEIKLRAIFLSHAGKSISFGDHNVSGLKGVYTYYKPSHTFLVVNLNEAPNFVNRTEFIEWFKIKFMEGMHNLNMI